MKKLQMMAAALALLPAVVRPTVALAEGDDLIVTGTRSPDPVRADLIGGSVTLIDAEALETRQTRDVSDILRDVPGVAVSRVAGQTQVRLRGTEANHVLVLVDGIEVSDAFVGEFDFDTLAADEGARVEILRGQQSSLYGSDAIGGVIQYLTATGRERPGLDARIEGGSFNTANAAVRLGGVSGPFDYAITGTLNSTDGTPNAVGGKRALSHQSSAAAFKTNWAVADNFHLTAVGRYSSVIGQSNDSDQDTTSPSYGLIIDTPGVSYATRAYYGLLRAQLDLLDGRWTQALSAQFADSERNRFLLGTQTSGSRGDRVKGSYETTVHIDSGRLRQAITFAADAERESYRNADPSGYASNARRNTQNYGLVAQYQLFLDDTASLAGSVRRDLNNRFADSTTYRVEGSYRLPTGTRVRAAAGSGIKNPGFYELYGFIDGVYIGNPNLKPEQSEGWEAGVEQSIGGGVLTVGATYFDSRLKDEIYTTYSADFVPTPSNRTTESTQHGVEIFAQARLDKNWRLDAAFTRLKARENGIEEVRRPSTTASVALGWRAPRDLAGVTVVARYNGSQTDVAYLDPNFGPPVTVSLHDYTLVNIDGDVKLTANLSAFARVENLLDESYQDVFSFRQPGRAAYAGLKVKL